MTAGTRNVGVVSITLEELGEVLGLPEGHKLVAVSGREFDRAVGLVIEGASMPPSDPGQMLSVCWAQLLRKPGQPPRIMSFADAGTWCR